MGGEPSDPKNENTRMKHNARGAAMRMDQSIEGMAADKIANNAPGLFKKKDLIDHIKKLQERVADIQNVVGSVLPAVQGDATNNTVPAPSLLTRNFRPTTNGRKLSDLRIAVVGLDGIGAMCAEMLARSGVGGLLLCDEGQVEERHLRTLFFSAEQKGLPRAEAVKLCVNDFAPQTQVETGVVDRVKEVLEGGDAHGDLDLVLDCLEAGPMRQKVTQACVDTATTRLECGLSQEAGCGWYQFYVGGVATAAGFELPPADAEQVAMLWEVLLPTTFQTIAGLAVQDTLKFLLEAGKVSSAVRYNTLTMKVDSREMSF